jgi:hypothetical protein
MKYVTNPGGKRPIEKYKPEQKYNIKIDSVIMWDSAYYIHLDQDRSQWRSLAKTVINFCKERKVSRLTVLPSIEDTKIHSNTNQVKLQEFIIQSLRIQTTGRISSALNFFMNAHSICEASTV